MLYRIFRNNKLKTQPEGFTLIELSIVLVIIGLVVGGILAGQSLIRAAEVRSVLSDLERYRTAVHTFQDKYSAIPGDMPNAFRFWGAELGCTDEFSGAASGTGCNGDGDGLVDDKTVTFNHGDYSESFRAWQHLSAADMVPGIYTGVSGPPASTFQPITVVLNENAPAAKTGDAGFLIESLQTYTGTSWYKRMEYGNVISVGNPTPGPGVSGVRGFFLTSSEAWSIDKKIDDGLPTIGNLVVYGDNRCRDGDRDTLDSPYNLDVDEISCALILRNVW